MTFRNSEFACVSRSKLKNEAKGCAGRFTARVSPNVAGIASQILASTTRREDPTFSEAFPLILVLCSSLILGLAFDLAHASTGHPDTTLSFPRMREPRPCPAIPAFAVVA